LKDSGSTIELEPPLIKLHSATEMTLEAVRDVLLQRAVKRQLSPKVFDYGKIEEAAKGTVRQTATLRQGLSQDLAREITKLIRDRLPKLKTQIQGDAVRVTGKSKDELQSAIQLLRKAEVDRNWPVPLSSSTTAELWWRIAPKARESGGMSFPQRSIWRYTAV
jgi:uncharacterized protein YajQ (UPF0234 family)